MPLPKRSPAPISGSPTNDASSTKSGMGKPRSNSTDCPPKELSPPAEAPINFRREAANPALPSHSSENHEPPNEITSKTGCRGSTADHREQPPAAIAGLRPGRRSVTRDG